MRQSAETVRPYIGVGGWHARNACDVGVMARLFDGREVAHGPRTYADRAVRQGLTQHIVAAHVELDVVDLVA